MAPDSTASAYYDCYWSPDGAGYRGREDANVKRLFLGRFPDGAADCLDVGCGDGEAAGRFLATSARSYIGVDVSSTAVEQARQRGLDARLIEDAASLPFEDASFDFIVCFEVYEHLFSTEEAAAEQARVLRPGGLLIIQVPNVVHWRHRLEIAFRGRFVAMGDAETLTRPWRDPHVRFFTFDSLTRLLSYSGLRVIASLAVGTNQLQDVPVFHRFARQRRPGRLSQALMNARPTVFANRILIVATRNQ